MNGEIVPVETEARALVSTHPQIIRPLASPEEALGAWQEFEALKGKLVTHEDIQHIQGKDFLKKSGFRKLATAFGLSTERMAEEREEIAAGAWLWRVTVRATAPNGRFCDGVAACASNERRMSHPEHDTYSTAYTRAANRAIGDLIGGGLVSAEEIKAEATPPLSRERAKELLEQFVTSCDKQSVYFDYPTLAELLLTSADDLRRAFKHFKAKSDGAPVEEAPDDD